MTEPSPLRRYGLLAALAVFVAHASRYPPVFEDSYISYRYADNLASGLGLVFNPGQPVEGFTSALWVLVLAAARLLVEDLQAVGPLLSAAAGAGVVAVTWALARRLLAPPWAAAAALLAAANASLACYAVTGMESTLFGLLLSGGLLLSALTDSRRGDVGLAVVAVLAALCRPEGMLYAPALIALGVRRRGWRRTAAVGAAFAAVYGAWFAWRWQHFGYPFPNTYYAKIGGEDDLLVGARYVEGFLWMHLGLVGLVGLAGLGRAKREALPLLAMAGLVLAATAWVGGDQFPLHRFLIPLVPMTAVGVGWLLQTVASREGPRLPAVAVALLMGLSIAAPQVMPPSFMGQHPSGVSDWERLRIKAEVTWNFERIAAWMRGALPPDTTLATNVAGVIPYRTGFVTLDMLGLNDEHIAHAPRSEGAARGHQKSAPDYVLAQGPDLILIGLPRVFEASPSNDALFAIWNASALPGDRVLLNSDAFHEAYELVKGPVDAEGYTAVFVRRERMSALFGGSGG